MIHAETTLLDSNTQARIASILELELRYLQDELSTISTQAALTGTAAFAAICVPQKEGSMRNGYGGEESNLALALQTVYIAVASSTCVLAALTVCSAMFLNLWGANDALRTKTIESLTEAITAIRQERILTLRLFTLSVISMLMTGSLLTWINWNQYAGAIATLIFGGGLFGVSTIYKRTKKMFKHSPPLFRHWNKAWYWFGFKPTYTFAEAYLHYDRDASCLSTSLIHSQNDSGSILPHQIGLYSTAQAHDHDPSRVRFHTDASMRGDAYSRHNSMSTNSMSLNGADTGTPGNSGNIGGMHGAHADADAGLDFAYRSGGRRDGTGSDEYDDGNSNTDSRNLVSLNSNSNSNSNSTTSYNSGNAGKSWTPRNFFRRNSGTNSNSNSNSNIGSGSGSGSNGNGNGYVNGKAAKVEASRNKNRNKNKGPDSSASAPDVGGMEGLSASLYSDSKDGRYESPV